MQKWVKNLLIGATAFTVWRISQLYKMFNALNWSFQNLKFTRPKLKSLADSYVMTMGFKIHNSSNTTLWLNAIRGYVEYSGFVLGRYYMGRTKIEAGDTKLTIELDLDPKYVATILIPDIVNRKAPIMDVTLNADLFLGFSVTERFKFNIKDYLPSEVSQLIFK